MGRRPAPKGTQATKRANASIPRELADEVDDLVQGCPEFGFTNRNDFVNRATSQLLRRCRNDRIANILLKAAEEGRTTPFDDLRKLGLLDD